MKIMKSSNDMANDSWLDTVDADDRIGGGLPVIHRVSSL